MSPPIERTPKSRLMELGRIASSISGHASWVEHYRDLKQARAFNAIRPWHRDNNTIFIHIPKAAGTSVRTSIGSPDIRLYPHIKAISYRTIDQQFFDNAFTFAVIRHPIERFLSAYSHIRKKKLENHDPILHHAPDLFDWPIFLRRFENSRWYRSIIFSALHFQPQWMFACDPNGDRIVKHLFAFEDMADVMCPVLSDHLGNQIHLNATNKSTRHEDGFELSAKAKDLILRFYERDLALYRTAQREGEQYGRAQAA